jgi:hypothetical protein
MPAKGFYFHYKHDPAGDLHNYTYEVIGVGRHTEDHSLTVLYRPLYQNDWLAPADYCSRPLEMFMGEVEIDGVTKSRFTRITSPKQLRALQAVSAILYG